MLSTAIENQAITEKIRIVHGSNKQTYGSPRITHELIKLDIRISHPRGGKLMKKAKIRSIVKRKFRVTTDSEHKHPIVEYKLKVGKTATVWVSDTIKTTQGWLYLTVILDLADRKIVGWVLSSTMKAVDTVIPALEMTQKNRRIMRLQRVFASAIRFKILKAECIHQNKFINKPQAAVIVLEHIEIWRPPLRYNRKRLHSALGYISPKKF